ncbi:MAG: NADH-quinone oxidoreductase subunit J [Candidatus Dadabacteria bacterium]|nr:MAG: NADH-quinone oxidoreductase subunit J [Candidatus Dadabacteria bacterium]
MDTFAFLVLATVITLSGIGVIAMRNPIHSALCLILNLACVAGIFALLGADFLAAAQIIVYAGAIMVLVLFVLMLLNLKVEKKNLLGYIYLAFGGLVSVVFILMFSYLVRVEPLNQLADNVRGSVAAMGKILYTDAIFPFEAASVLILAAITGAVMLGKRSYKKRTTHIKGQAIDI